MSDQASPGNGKRPSLPPVAYPLLGLVFGGILVFAFSRVLLAVTKHTAPAIGLLMALNILIGAALVAYGGRVRRRPASFPLLMVGGLAVIAVGVFAINLESRPEEAHEGGRTPAVIKLVAKGTAFDKKDLSFAAGSKVTIDFDNEDAGIQHNVAIFPEADPGQVVFRGQLVTGPTSVTYTFTAPGQPGTLVFHCDVHPTQMRGTVTITAGGGEAPGGGGGGGGPPTVVAKALAFQPTDLSVPGGGQVSIHFDNQDPSTPHNIHVFEGADATAPSLFIGDLITGPAEKTYTFAAPPPGEYFFHCDVHPTQMTGTLTVT